ncbi:uncharacterized protein Z520_02244 [Fonsecaea multimorphosa CBS 102226]|uniref:Uncharacterized protein n=1 Tax=Fonsecaea multimorphosa CBS 102226 TaxID=1442371 RepID=A0A0D2HJN1_9EURO|nr:uncharacterized protein Z520_02244 [Fonsecaea multimorphosa CBS 102226]KIY02106.1 hypothetical protein Z520_02244 [Fonsecaea multimorphosa CBS 102226]OAL29306.1 hypothetical protein AYO22_02200 [Fonsecaea multimorphosa]
MASYYGRGTPLAASVTSPIIEQAQTRLSQSERNYSRTQQDLENAMRIRATTPMSAMQLNAKDQEIAILQRKLSDQEAEMKGLRDTIERQQKTIKTQSEAISNPKQHYATPTPGRFGGNQPYGAHPNIQPPPPPPPPIFATGNAVPYTQPRPAITGPLHQQPGSTPSPFDDSMAQQFSALSVNQPQGPQMQHPQPTPFRQSGHVNEFGSPEPIRPYNTNLAITSTPMGPSRGNSGTPALASAGRMHTRGMPSTIMQQPQMPAFQPISMGPGIDLVVPEAVSHKFAHVLHMAQQYAYSHVNTPSTQKDNGMPQEVKDRLMRAASTTSAFQFMQTPYTRYLLVYKIIVQFMIKTILKHDCFAGFDIEADRVIEHCKNQMYQTTPAQVKYQLLTTMADQIQRLKTNLNFQTFVNNIARTRGNEIWRVLKPMMHSKTSRDWDDLYELMINAHQLAQMMFSGSEEYKFDFPTMGQLFSKDWMELRDPFKNVHTPEQLEAMGATVRLGFSPCISVRTSTPGGLVKSCTILKAFVLIKADK